ncbi:MAG: hypothetical protein QE487_02920 [Fluviicola sp.]|nr:hypothetical protein [Fluviicola sp.]
MSYSTPTIVQFEQLLVLIEHLQPLKPRFIKTLHSSLLIVGCALMLQCQSKVSTNTKSTSLSHKSTNAEATQSDEVIDSTHVVALKNNYSIEQQFSSMNIQYTLVKKVGNSVSRLDSISTYRGEDFYYRQRKLSYDFKNNWCVFGSTDSGSSDSDVTIYYVRVVDNRLKIILEFHAVSHYVTTGETPVTLAFMKTSVQSANKQQILLKSDYSFGELVEEGEYLKNEVNLKDNVTFSFNALTGVFEFEKCDNPRFSKIWKGESFLDVIPL